MPELWVSREPVSLVILQRLRRESPATESAWVGIALRIDSLHFVRRLMHFDWRLKHLRLGRSVWPAFFLLRGTPAPYEPRMHWIVMFRRMSAERLWDCCFNRDIRSGPSIVFLRPMPCCMRSRPLLACFAEK